MLCPLRRDAADGRADFTPAGAVLPGRLGRPVTEPIRRSPKQVGEAKGSQRPVGLGRHAGNCFPQTALHQVVRECFWIQEHEASLAGGGPYFNYVLTTMC